MSIRRMLRVASMVMGALGGQELASAAVGDLGENLEQARRTEFFRWFHLEETGRTGSVVHFKPSAEKFRALVSVNLSLDSRGRLAGAELVLSRAFIDSGVDGMFARDIAKSFLRVVTSATEQASFRGLLAEIEQPPARISTAPSPGYWTFLGEQRRYEQGVIRLENREVDGVRSLVIACP